MARRTGKTPRSQRTARTRTTGDDDIEVEVEDNGIELELGIEVKGMGASITSEGVLKLGVGVAAVELDLKEPNNSKVSYVWDLFEIEGERDGCTVVLTYKIKGVVAKTETRTIPECEDREREEAREEAEEKTEDDTSWGEDDENGRWGPGEKNLGLPPGNPNDEGIWWVVETRNQSNSSVNTITGESQSSYHIITAAGGGGGVAGFPITGRIATITGVTGWTRTSADGTTTNGGGEDSTTGAGSLSGSWSGWGRTRIILMIEYNGILENAFGYLALGKRSFMANLVQSSLTKDTIQASGKKEKRASLRWDESQNTSSETERVDDGIVSAYKRIRSLTVVAERITKPFGDNSHISVPPIRRKIMNDKCCQMIAGLYEVMAVDEMLDNGMKFPNRLITAGAKGYTEAFNYLEFLSLIVREIDHLGIHPHEVTIKDVDPGTPGDQKISAEFINATAWAQSLMENSLKSDGEADARLNLQIRLARLLLQTFVSSIAAKYKADAIADFLGVPTQEFRSSPSVPFDITLGQRKAKGFGTVQGDKDKIKKMSNQDVVVLLDKFLNEVKQDIVCERFDEREQSLLELLQQLVQRS